VTQAGGSKCKFYANVNFIQVLRTQLFPSQTFLQFQRNSTPAQTVIIVQYRTVTGGSRHIARCCDWSVRRDIGVAYFISFVYSPARCLKRQRRRAILLPYELTQTAFLFTSIASSVSLSGCLSVTYGLRPQTEFAF